MKDMTHLALSAACDRHLVAVDVTSQRTIEWTVTAPSELRRADRAPLHIALVLDRSGSMQGDKLRFVKQAAFHVLDMLDERDRLAVVVYDDQIDVLAGSTRVTPQTRDDLKRRIEAFRPGGWTDLSGGWLAGCREIAAEPALDGVSRALLLTDGMANRGITDTEELAHHARELRRRGIATSAFGVGLDFNENLLEALAEQGGGHFYYIEQPEQIVGVFARELGELLTVVAREAFLSIHIPRGVSVEVLGDLPHERSDERVRIFLGDLYAGERRAIFTRVLTPPDMPRTSVVLRGELGYANLDAQTMTIAEEIAFSYVREAEVLSIPIDESVLERASQVEMATATAHALRLERAGQRQEAQAVINHALAASATYMPAPAVAQYEALAGQVRSGMNESQRKETHFAAYRTRQSRGK